MRFGAIGSCLLFIAVGSSIIVVNNALLNGKVGFFRFPILVSTIGVFCSAIVATILVKSGLATVSHQAAEISDSGFYVRILPVGVMQATTMAAGNAAYMFLDIGTIQMLKAFTPVTVLALLVVFGLEKPQPSRIVSVVVIALGVFVTTISAWNITVMGIAMMAVADISEALKLVIVQEFLTNFKFSVVEGQYYIAPITAVSLLLASACIEGPYNVYIALSGSGVLYSTDGAVLLIGAAVLGVAVNYVGFWVIKEVGSLSLKLLGNVRSIALVMFSYFIGESIVTAAQAAGYLISLVGLVAYYYLSSQPAAADAPNSHLQQQHAQENGDEQELQPLDPADKDLERDQEGLKGEQQDQPNMAFDCGAMHTGSAWSRIGECVSSASKTMTRTPGRVLVLCFGMCLGTFIATHGTISSTVWCSDIEDSEMGQGTAVACHQHAMLNWATGTGFTDWLLHYVAEPDGLHNALDGLPRNGVPAKVGVCICARNEESVIAFTTKAALLAFDVVAVIDTGSHDLSVPLLRELFPAEISSRKLLIEEIGDVHGDMSAARLHAIKVLKAAGATYLVKADADDVPIPEAGAALRMALPHLPPRIRLISPLHLQVTQRWPASDKRSIITTLQFWQSIVDDSRMGCMMGSGSLEGKHETATLPERYSLGGWGFTQTFGQDNIFRMAGISARGKWTDETRGKRPEGFETILPGVQKKLKVPMFVHYGWARPYAKMSEKHAIYTAAREQDRMAQKDSGAFSSRQLLSAGSSNDVNPGPWCSHLSFMAPLAEQMLAAYSQLCSDSARAVFGSACNGTYALVHRPIGSVGSFARI